MNRTRMIILAAVALALSGGITYMAYRLLAPRLQAPDQMTRIVVAANAISLGTRITEKDVALAPWPKASLPAGSFLEASQVVGRGAISQIYANEPVLESRLAPKEMGAGLTAAIPDGMRAVSIAVNQIIGVAGFVQPGSRVDLILTGMPPKATERASKIVLENLQVLATGQNVQQDVEGKPQTVQVVTLLVTPEQAAKIALATGDGPIILALRNPMDLKEVETPLIPREVLYGGEVLAAEKTLAQPRPKVPGGGRPVASVRKPVAPAPPPLPPPPKVVTVELIQGPTRSTATFQEAGSPEKKP